MKSNRRIFQIVLAILCLIASIFVYLYIRYDIKSSIENVQFKQSNLKKSSVYDIGTQEKLLKIYNETLSSRKEIDDLIPNIDDSLKFVEAIENLAKISSTTINIGELNKSSIEDFPSFNILSSHISIKGKWDNVMNFIYKIESLPNLIVRVENLSMTSQGFVTVGKVKTNEWGAQFDVRIIIKSNE